MGGGASRSVVTNSLNEMITQSFLQVTVNCQQFAKLVQDVEVECLPNASLLDGNTFYEENSSCIQCWNDIVEQQQSKYNIIQEGWKGGKVKIPMTFNTEFEGYYAQMLPCLLRCKACVFSDFSQTNNYEWDTSCSLQLQDVNNMKNKLQANISQALTDNQDVLSSLAKLFGSSDKQTVVTNIMNRLNTRITLGFMENLSSQMGANQTIVARQSGSAIAQGITQSAAVTGLSKLVAQHNITNNILSNAQWSVFQELYNQQNTVDELGQVISKGLIGIADLVDTLLGKIMIAVIAAVILILVVIAVIAIVKAVKRHKAEKRGAV